MKPARFLKPGRFVHSKREVMTASFQSFVGWVERSETHQMADLGVQTLVWIKGDIFFEMALNVTK